MILVRLEGYAPFGRVIRIWDGFRKMRTRSRFAPWLFSLMLAYEQARRSIHEKTRTGNCAGFLLSGGERGIRTPGTRNYVRQFSKLVVSATHPPHR